MKKYLVELTTLYRLEREIEAENEEDAIALAIEACTDDDEWETVKGSGEGRILEDITDEPYADDEKRLAANRLRDWLLIVRDGGNETNS
jgi:hypothetical protein